MLLEFLISFVGGVMEGYFRQQKIRPRFVFTATSLFFATAFGIGLPLTQGPNQLQHSWGTLVLVSIGFGIFMGLAMIALTRPRKTDGAVPPGQ